MGKLSFCFLHHSNRTALIYKVKGQQRSCHTRSVLLPGGDLCDLLPRTRVFLSFPTLLLPIATPAQYNAVQLQRGIGLYPSNCRQNRYKVSFNLTRQISVLHKCILFTSILFTSALLQPDSLDYSFQNIKYMFGFSGPLFRLQTT